MDFNTWLEKEASGALAREQAAAEAYADHCEEPVQGDAVFVMRECRGRGLRVMVHPDRVTRKVMCSTHSLKAYPSGWLVDWDESARAFGTKRPSGKLRDGIDRS